MQKITSWLNLRFILFFSVILHVTAAFYLGDQVTALPGTADQVSYHNLALRVLNGHGFSFGTGWWPATAADAPTAHWSYLYTLYLAGIYSLFGPHPLVPRLIQAVVVGVLHPYLAYRVAKQLFASLPLNEKALDEHRFVQGAPPLFPLFAAGITAIYSYFVYYGATLMTESFYIMALLAALSLTIDVASSMLRSRHWRRAAAGLGLVLAVAVLLRQLFLLLVPVLFLWLMVVLYKRVPWIKIGTALVIPTAILLLGILPFSTYNYIRFDQFVLLNTNAGYAFYLANHPTYGSQFVAASEMGNAYGDLIPAEFRGLDEAALDKALLKQGIQFVLADPMRYVQLSLSRIPHYFKFWPDPDSSPISNIARISSFGFFLPFMIYGLFRAFAIQRRFLEGRPFLSSPVGLMYLFIAAYTGVHLLVWAQIRYRLPVDAVLVLFAGLALADLSTWLRLLIRHRIQKRQRYAESSLVVDRTR